MLSIGKTLVCIYRSRLKYFVELLNDVKVCQLKQNIKSREEFGDTVAVDTRPRCDYFLLWAALRSLHPGAESHSVVHTRNTMTSSDTTSREMRCPGSGVALHNQQDVEDPAAQLVRGQSATLCQSGCPDPGPALHSEIL